jgi:hypothetical protein
MKYQPKFPELFGCKEDAEIFCRSHFNWYDREHHHVGLGSMTPDQVHYGQADLIYAARQEVLNAIPLKHLERFINGHLAPSEKQVAVWINKPKEDNNQELLQPKSVEKADNPFVRSENHPSTPRFASEIIGQYGELRP